jgi:hypothetical protein
VENPGIHSGSIVCSVANLPFSRLHEDLLAIDQKAGYCYSMNSSAARIWELIPNPTAVSSICAVLCEEFGVEKEQCRQDVVNFLAALADAGLVKVTD